MLRDRYFNLAYSDLAAMRIGTSGSASFHGVTKSRYAAPDFAAPVRKVDAKRGPRRVRKKSA
jgi:hypothetical protein